MDDQRRQDRFGQVLEQRRQDEDRDEREQRRRSTGESSERAPAPSLTADCERLPPAGETADETRPGVRDPERDQLLIGIDLVAVLGRERLRGPERLAVDDEHHPGRGRDQPSTSPAGEVREADRGQAAGNDADDGDPCSASSSAALSAIPTDEAISPPGNLGANRSTPNSSTSVAEADEQAWRRSSHRGSPTGGRTGGSCRRRPSRSRRASAAG